MWTKEFGETVSELSSLFKNQLLVLLREPPPPYERSDVFLFKEWVANVSTEYLQTKNAFKTS